MSNVPKKRKLNASLGSSQAPIQDPSVIIGELKISLPLDTFLQLLEKNIYPVLDALPKASKSRVSNALVMVQHQTKRLQKLHEIGLERHEESLGTAVEALREHIEKHRKMRAQYETQEEMMDSFASEVMCWLPSLWRVAVEEGVELDVIRKCLHLCTTTIHQIAHANSITDFDPSDFEFTVENSKGTTIIEESNMHIEDSLAWMWRELLIVTAVKGTSTQPIQFHIKELKIHGRVYSLFRLEGRMSGLLASISDLFSTHIL
jgi:hypothetical protein